MRSMEKISRFEDLVAWQLAIELPDLIEAMVSKGPASENPTFVDQILRASSKAPAQIAEGFLRYTAADSANDYRMARVSLGETQTHLARGRRRKYFGEPFPDAPSPQLNAEGPKALCLGQSPQPDSASPQALSPTA